MMAKGSEASRNRTLLRDMSQWRIQDFPEGVRQLPKVLLFFNIFAQNCMKVKEFWLLFTNLSMNMANKKDF